jgi:YHS domain-containing protein
MKHRRLIIDCLLAMAGIAIPASGQTKKSAPPPKSKLPPKTSFAPKSVPQSRPDKVRDPVCGLMVEKDPELSAVYKGQTYYFCSKADRDKFIKNPGKYVDTRTAPRGRSPQRPKTE